MHWLLRQFTRAYRVSQWQHRRFTPAGRGLGYLLIAAAAFGLDTQRTTAFQIFAVTAALLLVAWLASLRLRPKLAAERRLPEFATVGEPLRYRQIVRNTGTRPLLDLRLRDELADAFPTAVEFRAHHSPLEPGANWVDRHVGFPRWLALVQRRRGAIIDEVRLPGLLPQRSAEVSITLTPLRRGALNFARSRLLRPDPLGLVNSVSTLEAPGRLVVLPRRYPLPPLALPGTRRFQRGGVSLSQNVGDSQEFNALREYRPGDPMRHIHWRSFARLGEPVVKEFQDEFFTRYALVLDSFGEDLPEPVFEAAVSVAASFVDSMHTQDALLDLMFVEDRAWRLTIGRGLGQVSDLLRVLAFVEPRSAGGFARLAQHVLGHAPALSACVLVLLRLDDERRRLLRTLSAAGVHLLVLLTGAGDTTTDESAVPVHSVDPGDVAASLARLGKAA
jgi:uncharacterized protein (DUF58 family)